MTIILNTVESRRPLSAARRARIFYDGPPRTYRVVHRADVLRAQTERVEAQRAESMR